MMYSPFFRFNVKKKATKTKKKRLKLTFSFNLKTGEKMSFKTSLSNILILFLIYSNSYAQQTEVIELQERAWLARGNVVISLNLKENLQVGDQIRTGKNSRVWLKLPDNSVVKLGEFAMFTIHDLKSSNNLLQGSFELLRGAFRLTTPPQTSTKHDFKIKINAITAGIRGTDIWGSIQTDKDLICLLEGQISVQSGVLKATLSKPRDYFIVSKNTEPTIGVLEDDEKLKEWVKSTELQ